MRHVLITHDHADHIKSVGAFSNEYNVPVYATQEVHDGINRNYCVVKKVPAELVGLVEKGKTIQLGDFTVTPFTVPHDSADNVGYFIEADGTNFCLITDAGSVTDEMQEYISKARHLVIEANHDIEMVKGGPYPQFLKDRILSGTGHLNNHDCGIAIIENMSEQLKNVWLCHLSAENNLPDKAHDEVAAKLRENGIVPGEDVNIHVLMRKKVSGPWILK